jgi:hypothetical protein
VDISELAAGEDVVKFTSGTGKVCGLAIVCRSVLFQPANIVPNFLDALMLEFCVSARKLRQIILKRTVVDGCDP